MPAGSILVADDDTAIRTVLNQALSRAGYEVRLTGNAATLWRWVSQGEGDLVITDVVMPDENAFDLLPRIKKMRPNLPVIVMSAQNTFMTAIRASERGAYEYLPKPFDLKELIAIVGRALAEPKERVASAPDDAEFDFDPAGRPFAGDAGNLSRAGAADADRPDRDDLGRIRHRQGTGRARAARLRQAAQRAVRRGQHGGDPARPDRVANCSATRSGAFTGANTRASGRFEQAEGGTLFLDEIGDMPMEAQTRLLRVLQQGEYTTVGGRTPIKADVRIVAASNKDLRILIQQGLFREDLFFRLNVVPLRLPPLRERIEDMPDLIRHFFALAEKDGLPPKKLDAAGAGASEAASLAGQRPRTRKSRAPARGALSAGRHYGLGDRRRTGAAGRSTSGGTDAPGHRQSRRRGRSLSVLALLGLPEWRAAAGPLSPHPARRSKSRCSRPRSRRPGATKSGRLTC